MKTIFFELIFNIHWLKANNWVLCAVVGLPGTRQPIIKGKYIWLLSATVPWYGQISPRTWQFYFQARRLKLANEQEWNLPTEALNCAIVACLEDLRPDAAKTIYSELRRVHSLAHRRGIEALRNCAKPESALHDDFPQLTSDAERALWVIINWPDLFEAAEAIHAVNQRVGTHGWKRLQIAPVQSLCFDEHDIRALELALAEEFTSHKGHRRACQIEWIERHLDGGVQLHIMIEGHAQRQLEFGVDNRAYWRDVRPSLNMDVVIYPKAGVIDILVAGGLKPRQLLEHINRHVLKSRQTVKQTAFFLNRLRNGFDLFEDGQVDLAAYKVERIRLTQVQMRVSQPPHCCDYTLQAPAHKDAPDVFASMKEHRLAPVLMSQDFNIVGAVVSLYFLPVQMGKPGRVLHLELKQAGITNLRYLDEADTQLAEALLQAWGVMQSNNIEPSSGATMTEVVVT